MSLHLARLLSDVYSCITSIWVLVSLLGKTRKLNREHTLTGRTTQKCGLQRQAAFFGDPYGNRTHVTAVKGRCLNRLTNGPGSGNLIRTDDIPGMNRLLYQLSYAAMWSMQFRHRRNSFCIISDTPRFVKTFFAFFEKFSRGRLRPTDS